jgi:peptide/nickel transport system substrate-binding protein
MQPQMLFPTGPNPTKFSERLGYRAAEPMKQGVRDMPSTRRVAVAGAALAVLGSLLAACGGTTAKVGNGAAVKGQLVHGGTVVVSQISGATPNDIFPLQPATNSNGYNLNLVEGAWPNIVTVGDGTKSVVNAQESLFSSMTWSNNDTTFTMVLKPWKWSDGVPITVRDFTFVYNLLKANYNDWLDYYPGQFPADVTKVTTQGSSTVVVDLKHAENPSFYTDDILNYVPLLPQHVMDRESLTGKVGNFDETTAGAKTVWTFLQKQGLEETSFTTNPLWQVVDGPWRISTFQSDGYYAWTPNNAYSGPDKPILSKVEFTPFTTDAAEVDTLRSGTSGSSALTVGYLPLNDVKQIPQLEAEGYDASAVPTPGVAEVLPNLYNPTNGPILRQLYIRQAMEDLIDRPLIVSKVFAGYADPGNGAVPVNYGQQWDSPAEKGWGPYPYDPSKAIALLKANGWKVVPNGVDTCQKAGSGPGDCGAGITAGEQLAFTMLFASGSDDFDEQNADIQTTEALGGIKITLKGEPFNTLVATTGTCNAQSHPTSICNWQLQQYGYDPYSLDPSGAGLWNTDGVSNYGGYSSPEMDSLINQTEYGSSSSAFFAYENYAAQQLPVLYLPNADFIWLYKKNLANAFPASPFDATVNPEIWYYTKPAK